MEGSPFEKKRCSDSVAPKPCTDRFVRVLPLSGDQIPSREKAETLAQIPSDFLLLTSKILEVGEATGVQSAWAVEREFRCPLCSEVGISRGTGMPEGWLLEVEHGRILPLSDYMNEIPDKPIWLPGDSIVIPVSADFISGLMFALNDPWTIEMEMRLWHP